MNFGIKTKLPVKTLAERNMENYTKGETTEVEDRVDLQFDEKAIHMRVAAGSKIRNLMGFAMKQMKDPNVKEITWNGTGPGINKTLACTEIMKRKIKGLHQITKVRFKRIEEHWEPQKEGLERLKVNRDVPAITILLSKTPLDSSIPGYQPPGSFEAFWKKLSAPSANKSSKKQNKSSDATGNTDSQAYGSLTKRKRKRGAGKETSKSEVHEIKEKSENEKKKNEHPKPKQKSVDSPKKNVNKKRETMEEASQMEIDT